MHIWMTVKKPDIRSYCNPTRLLSRETQIAKLTGEALVRSEQEIRQERARIIEQQRSYRHALNRIEAAACSIQVSLLTWVLGEKESPNIRIKVED